nr:hypothetical protein [Tanacetum cinerariifolium]
MSSIAKFDVKKFNGSNDFGLWRVKMWCLLIQHGWEVALDPFPRTMTDADNTAALKTYVYKKAHSALLLCLDNKELEKRTDAKDNGDGLYVRGMSDHRACPKRNIKKSTSSVKKNAGQGSGMYYEGYDNGDLLMAVSEERFLEWIMDSGGSFHMMPRRDFLFDFKEFNGGTVFLDDNRACVIMGIGKMKVQMKDGLSFVLENMRCIPNLKRNLISLGTLNREGYTVKLQNGRVKVIKGSLMVLSGTMKGNCVHSLDGWTESGEASVGIQEKESLAQVWHKRLGHISEAGLHKLEKRKVLGNKGLGKLEFCEKYVFEKSSRVCFGRGQHTTEGVIDYVHVDLWGPSRVESMSRCRYFLSIVDDYSRRGWVHFIRHKNDAFNEFKEWKQLVENQTSRKLKKLRTDNGLEFCNQSLSTALKKKTPVDLWSRYLENYEMIRIFGCVAYLHVNQGKLKLRAIKCIYLWDVVFNESLMYKYTLKGAGVAYSEKEVEFEVELQGSRNLDYYVLMRDRAKETTFIPTRYRDEGNVSFFRQYGSKVDDIAAYAFAIVEEEDTHEPITFQEAINSSKKDEWVRAMEEEMSSLNKNHI